MSSHDLKKLYRQALGNFATGVTVVTTIGQNQEWVGMTASSFNTVSLEPPLVLWSISRAAKSFPAFMQANNFAVNVLRADQEEISRRFSHSGADKWHGIDVLVKVTGCPLLAQAAAHFECRKVAAHDGGDHVIMVGEVVQYDHDPAARALLFWKGHYHQIAD